MLSPEKVEQIKQQIFGQIESSFPEDKKEEAKAKVLAMSSEELENFLSQNNLIQEQGPLQDLGELKCPFCLILSKQIPSYQIEENKDSLAVLEINPISKGHSIIIPREHLNKKKIKKPIHNLADKISKKIRSKFKTKGFIVHENRLFDHGILDVIPIYNDETRNSKRKQIEKTELEEIQKILLQKKVKKKPVKKKAEPKKKLIEKIEPKRRIP
ncbi:MAG: HIT domain-containing protein [Candidatus Pacearchaeota archaeon]